MPQPSIDNVKMIAKALPVLDAAQGIQDRMLTPGLVLSLIYGALFGTCWCAPLLYDLLKTHGSRGFFKS